MPKIGSCETALPEIQDLLADFLVAEGGLYSSAGTEKISNELDKVQPKIELVLD